MQVTNITKPGVQTYKNNGRPELFESSLPVSEPGKSDSQPHSRDLNLSGYTKVLHIVSGHKIRNITAPELADMGRQLFESDIITPDDYRALSYQKRIHSDYFPSPESEESLPPQRDFIQFWQDTLNEEIKNRNPRGMAVAGRIVNILENLNEVSEQISDN